jgi:site-specific recombinase XerD
MRVQDIIFPETEETTWIVLDDDHLPVSPVNRYLTFLRNSEKSPNTVKNYACHLKLFWEFLSDKKIEWEKVTLDHLAQFIAWLRRGDRPGVTNINNDGARRKEKTINTIISAVASFYDYQQRVGSLDQIPLFRTQFNPRKRYKPFLHHVSKKEPERRSVLKLREPKTHPKTLTKDQVEQLIGAANNRRDKFLIALLDESGMRTGEALGLRHSDILSYDNQIKVVRRDDNENKARAKGEDRTIDVSKELMALYHDYLIYELGDDLSDYVFVNLWEGLIGHPMTYDTVAAMFRRLRKKVGFYVTAHMLRHTHATEMLRAGNDLKHVQDRLGHKSIQSTQVYLHLTRDDLKKAHQKYHNHRQKLQNGERGDHP